MGVLFSTPRSVHLRLLHSDNSGSRFPRNRVGNFPPRSVPRCLPARKTLNLKKLSSLNCRASSVIEEKFSGPRGNFHSRIFRSARSLSVVRVRHWSDGSDALCQPPLSSTAPLSRVFRLRSDRDNADFKGSTIPWTLYNRFSIPLASAGSLARPSSFHAAGLAAARTVFHGTGL